MNDHIELQNDQCVKIEELKPKKVELELPACSIENRMTLNQSEFVYFHTLQEDYKSKQYLVDDGKMPYIFYGIFMIKLYPYEVVNMVFFKEIVFS